MARRNVTTTTANEFILTFLNVSGGGSATPYSIPQTMTQAQAAAANDTSAYGVALTAGANYVQWEYSGYPTLICDTIAVH
jgi:hypothetical protein